MAPALALALARRAGDHRLRRGLRHRQPGHPARAAGGRGGAGRGGPGRRAGAWRDQLAQRPPGRAPSSVASCLVSRPLQRGVCSLCTPHLASARWRWPSAAPPPQGAYVSASDISAAMAGEAQRRYEEAVKEGATPPKQVGGWAGGRVRAGRPTGAARCGWRWPGMAGTEVDRSARGRLAPRWEALAAGLHSLEAAAAQRSSNPVPGPPSPCVPSRATL